MLAMAKVVCFCYGDRMEFQSKKKAVEFFEDCMFNTEGAERDRYISILQQLKAGCKVCYDDVM